jgi:hypothetical protein
MLQPLRPKEEPVQGSDSPIVTCEACRSQGPSHRMINLAIVVGSPGHESLTGFQCPGSKQMPTNTDEHWACSIECWAKVAHACIDEHMAVLLQQLHSRLKEAL